MCIRELESKVQRIFHLAPNSAMNRNEDQSLKLIDGKLNAILVG